MYDALSTFLFPDASPSFTKPAILAVPSTVARVGESIAPSATFPANLRVMGKSDAMYRGTPWVILKPSSSSLSVKTLPLKLTFFPDQRARRIRTYSLILLRGFVSLAGNILYPISGIVGKLPNPRPRIARPSESSARFANVVAVVTGCLVNVLMAPDAALIRVVDERIEARYVTTSLW